MPIYDLHTHSNISDGILDPESLVSRAKAKGVDVIALTDHDSVAGLARARASARDLGLQLVNGIEFSGVWGKSGVHIVGLGIDPGHPVILEAVAHQAEVRELRAQKIGERLARVGVTGVLEGARAIAGDSVIGRPHFARYLVETGAVTGMHQAFKKYLGAGKPGDVKNLWPDMSTVIDWIRAAGGVAVLAHPEKYKMTRTKLRALVADFSEAGGRALEVMSGHQESGVTDRLARLATEQGLYASCGSDFHMPDQPWQELGAFGTMPAACKPVWQLWAQAQ